MKKIIVIGGLPNPIGGVTTFLKRFCQRYSDKVELIFDCYPSNYKDVPTELKEKFISIKSKFLLPIYFLYFWDAFQNKKVFFNFSGINSVLFIGLLPKRQGTHWHLMLHHGDLKITNSLFGFLIKFFMRKVDVVHYMSESQREVLSHYVNDSKLLYSTSFVKATLDRSSEEFECATEFINRIKDSGYKKIFICSGYASSIYNHVQVLRLLDTVLSSCYLVMFLYGPKEGRGEILDIARFFDNVKVFQDESEIVFNSYLSLADCYIRPTEKDSFGIAVADAINFGVSVIASDVCPRYKGAFIYNILSVNGLECALNKFLNDEDLIISNYSIKEFDLGL